jgi:hypothetical protein
MAVGDSSLIAGYSYCAVGRETATGTYNTCTAGLEFISLNLKTVKEIKALEQIQRERTLSKSISLGKVVEGEVEFYYQPRLEACQFLLQNAFGGAVTSATATGETVGAGASSAMVHTFNIGDIAAMSFPALCLNVRKGQSATGKIFQYSGVRVDEMMFTAELDEPLMCKANVVCMDSTLSTNDVASASLPTTATALSFVSGRLSVEASFSSLTSTSFWHIQTVEFGHSNALKKDTDSRRIGSDTLAVLPSGIANFTLNTRIRFNTTTAFDAMMNATQFAAEVEFLGPTLPGSSIRQGIKMQYPKVIISEAGDPEIGGPDEMLMSDITFLVLRDDSSATGYACRALVTNQATAY